MYNVFPLHRRAEDWVRHSGVILISWGVYSPNGPTIACIGQRDTGARGEKEIFYRWMHYLGGEDYCLGYVRPQDPTVNQDFAELLEHGFSLQVGTALRSFPLVTTVPSLVRCDIPAPWTPVITAMLARTQAFQEADWGKELYLRDKYRNDLMGRMGEEVREAYEALKVDPEYHTEKGQQMSQLYLRYAPLPEFAAWEPDRYEQRRIAEGDVNTWWSFAADPEFLIRAQYQFALAWVVATHASDMSNREVITPLEEVRDFFAHFSQPWWSEDLTTKGLWQEMSHPITHGEPPHHGQASREA